MAKILVIDDQRAIRTSLKDILEMENHNVDLAEDGDQGLTMFDANAYDLVLTDIKMPGHDGIEVLAHIHQAAPATPVVMISGHGTVETAVESIKGGAYDFIEKPLDLNRLLVTIKNALERSSLEAEKRTLVAETKALRRQVETRYEMIGDSTAMEAVRTLIDKVAPTDARVLILGENGTGKELVARALHEASPRATGPFIEVNCAAIPSELIESELFGHEKGSFTSAVKQRIGKFEQASGGTLFLDEIGDMSLSAQSKVLRALQESAITRVGGEKEIKVDVRVLAATNKHLSEEIHKGTFREDLYHRLSVIIIEVPSLNQRVDDIPALANYFLKLVSTELRCAQKAIDPDAITALQAIHWTGNIREFRNVIERLTILAGDVITAQDVAAYARPVG